MCSKHATRVQKACHNVPLSMHRDSRYSVDVPKVSVIAITNKLAMVAITEPHYATKQSSRNTTSQHDLQYIYKWSCMIPIIAALSYSQEVA